MRAVSPDILEDRIVRAGSAAVGGLLSWSAVLAAEAARAHMGLIGTICGSISTPHCGWCFAAAGLTAGAVLAFRVAFGPSAKVRSPGLLQIKAGGRKS